MRRLPLIFDALVASIVYSMSAQIGQERNAYYDILEQTQKGPLDITLWMQWFLNCLGQAIDGAETALSAVLAKAGSGNVPGTFL